MTAHLLAEIILTTTLVTNVTYEYPKQWRAIPCPDKMIGCLVNHGDFVSDTSAGVRTQVTEVREVSRLEVWGHSIEVTNKLVSAVRVAQELKSSWQSTGGITNVPSSSWGITFTNIMRGTNIWIATNVSGGVNIIYDTAEWRKE